MTNNSSQLEILQMIEQVSGLSKQAGSPVAQPNDTIYLCNFRVSVDGEWLCLKVTRIK